MRIFQILMWLVGMVLSLVEPAAVADPANSSDSPYVEVFFYNGPKITSDNQIGGARCSPSGYLACGGLYAIGTDGRSTIMTGPNVLTFRLDSSRYILLYDFTLELSPDSLTLLGQFYSLQLDGNGNVTGGKKVPISWSVQYDVPWVYHFSTGGGGQLTVQYFVRRNWPGAQQQEVSYGNNTITVKSLCRASGITTKVGNTQPLVWDPKEKIRVYGSATAPWEFPAEFATSPVGDHDEALSYRVTLSFDPPIGSGNYPIRTIMELSRQYWLDTLHTVNEPINSNWGTGSQYRKEVELVKGKVLKLVFPPDNESLRGFRVEDTIIINP